MTKKPTYEELEQRVRELEKEYLERKQIEDALLKSEEKFRDLFNNAGDAIFIRTREGRFLEVNQVACDRYGYRRKEFLQMSPKDLDTPNHSERIPERTQSILQKGRHVFETVHVTKEKKVIPVEISSRTIDFNGQTAIISIDRDITERKRTEESLRESEARFRDTATMLPSVIIEYDLNGNITYVNPHGFKIAGYKPEDLEEGFHVLQMVAPEEHEKHYARIQRMLQGQKLPPTEYRLLRKDGSIFWGLVTSSLIHKDGKVAGIRTYTIDISERKEVEKELLKVHKELEQRVQDRTAELVNTNKKLKEENKKRKTSEEALRESEEKYRNLVERANDGVIIIQNGTIKFSNTRLAEMLGFTVEEMINTPFLDHVFPDERSRIADIYKQRLQDEDPPDIYEMAALHKDGRKIDIETNSGIISYHGKPATLSFIRDITQRKRTEGKIKASLKEKEALLSEIHHRVKNNFEIVSSLLDMSSMQVENKEMQNLWEDTRARIHSMALIHDQLYQTDRFDQIDMERHVRNMLDHISHIYAENRKWITSVIEPSEVYLSVKQAIPCALVLNELITNSFKHAFKKRRKGTIRVSVNISTDDTVLISVKDDGDGLPEGIDFNNARGLGLKLVRHLVGGQLNGEMRVNNGRGTEICIEFKMSN